MTLTTRLRSVLNDARERAARGATDDSSPSGVRRAGGAGARAEPDTKLFECPSCDNVYVAVEKSTCSNCDTAVEEVAATLARE